jgi:hypothetical protein
MKSEIQGLHLSWYNPKNYEELESLTLYEIYLEVKLRYSFNISFLLDHDGGLEFWSKRIYQGNPILSQHLIKIDDIVDVTKENMYRIGGDLSFPSVNLSTFTDLEKCFNFYKKRINELEDKSETGENFRYKPLITLLKDDNINLPSLFSVYPYTATNSTLATMFMQELEYTRQVLRIPETQKPQKRHGNGKFKEFRLQPSFFKSIVNQRLLQITDCFNWYSINQQEPKKIDIINAVFPDNQNDQANIYLTQFPNSDLLRQPNTLDYLHQFLVEQPNLQSVKIKDFISES